MSLQPQAASLQDSAAPLRKLAARGPGRSWSVGENGVNVVVFVFVLVYLPAQSPAEPPVGTFLLRVTSASPEPPWFARHPNSWRRSDLCQRYAGTAT